MKINFHKFGSNGTLITGGGSAGVQAIGDLNNDGIDELKIDYLDKDNQYKSAIVFGGSFGNTINLGTAGLNFLKFTNGTLSSIDKLGDINADGKDDFAVNYQDDNGATRGSLILGGSTGKTIDLTHLETPAISGGTINYVRSTIDINQDGKNDIQISYSDPKGVYKSAFLYSGQISEQINLNYLQSSGFNITGSDIYLTRSSEDINHDGKYDLQIDYWASSNSKTSLYFGDFSSDINLANLGNNGITFTGASNFRIASTYDLNGDGIDDYVVGYQESIFSYERKLTYLFSNQITGVINIKQPGLNGITFSGGTVKSIRSAEVDFNNDGKDDFLVHYTDVSGLSKQSFLLAGMLGNNVNLSNPGSMGITFTGGTFSELESIGDLNGDGKNEFGVWYKNLSNNSTFKLFSGGETSNIINLSSDDHSIAITGGKLHSISEFGDFNGDGKKDYVAIFRHADGFSYESKVLLGGKVGSSIDLASLGSAGINFPDVTLTKIELIDDINADGVNDYNIRYEDFSGSRKSALLYAGSAGNIVDLANLDSSGISFINGQLYSISQILDFNSDGKTDYAISYINDSLAFKSAVLLGGKFGGQIDLAELGNSIFSFGSSSIVRVSSSFDFNADGKSDYEVLYTDTSGKTFTTYLYAGKLSDAINLAAPGNAGFKITDDSTYAYSITKTFDFNADGYDDFQIDYSNDEFETSKTSYLLAGQITEFVKLTDPGTSGFYFNGSSVNNIQKISDVNNDGLSDFLISYGYNTTNDSTYSAIFYASPIVKAGYFTGGTTDNDSLSGDIGNDTLDGGAGIDSMSGGKGDDTYIVDSIKDIINEAGDDTGDLVQASISIDLASKTAQGKLKYANIEHVTLTGNAKLNASGDGSENCLTGNNNANKITGGAGNDTLDGGAGKDTLSGGNGNDTYVVDTSSDIIIETGASKSEIDIVSSSVSYTLGANLETIILEGDFNINATGNSLNNRLVGNSGNNILNGGTGIDIYNGGAGNDIYIIDREVELTDITDDDGNDTIVITYAASKNASSRNHQEFKLSDLGNSIENLIITGSGYYDLIGDSNNNLLKGNVSNNILIGGSGDDTLDGGAGKDSMDGGDGIDLYVVDNLGDIINDTGADYGNHIQSSISIDLSIQNIEGIFKYANIQKVALTGKAALNATGSEGDEELIGNIANNKLSGNEGNDSLSGGLGKDSLTGGEGADLFMFDSALLAGKQANIDTIADFEYGFDQIGLSANIFSALSELSDISEVFRIIEIGQSVVATSANDHLLYDHKTGSIWYDADGNGAAQAIKFAVIQNSITAESMLSATDFILL